MPTAGWWEALWPDPAGVLAAVGIKPGMEVIDLCSGDGAKWSLELRGERDFSRTSQATATLRTTKPISAVLSGKRLDFRTTRPSKILATNSETFGFQDHPLRQAVRA